LEPKGTGWGRGEGKQHGPFLLLEYSKVQSILPPLKKELERRPVMYPSSFLFAQGINSLALCCKLDLITFFLMCLLEEGCGGGGGFVGCLTGGGGGGERMEGGGDVAGRIEVVLYYLLKTLMF
jgi:hypothetical protein